MNVYTSRRPAVYTSAGVLLGFAAGVALAAYAFGVAGVPGKPVKGPIGGP